MYWYRPCPCPDKHRREQHYHHRSNHTTTDTLNIGGRNLFEVTVGRRRTHDETAPPPRSNRRHHTPSSSPFHDRSRRHHPRPAFASAAKKLFDALEAAETLCKELLVAHNGETGPLRRFAERRVLDAVWCARVRKGERCGVYGDNGREEMSEMQKMGDAVGKVERALAEVARARIVETEAGGGGYAEEMSLMRQVKRMKESFPGLVDAALREVQGMEFLVAEMKFLKRLLNSESNGEN